MKGSFPFLNLIFNLTKKKTNMADGIRITRIKCDESRKSDARSVEMRTIKSAIHMGRSNLPEKWSLALWKFDLRGNEPHLKKNKKIHSTLFTS